jgi:hypothetical protein
MSNETLGGTLPESGRPQTAQAPEGSGRDSGRPDIVERLRNPSAFPITQVPTFSEAAAAIEALRAERDAQKKAARAYYDTVVEVHHALGRAGWHPGRTDDRITDIIKAKGEEMKVLRAERDAALAREKGLRELLAETLRPGAYGVGSTLASRIEAALAAQEADRAPGSPGEPKTSV